MSELNRTVVVKPVTGKKKFWSGSTQYNYLKGAKSEQDVEMGGSYDGALLPRATRSMVPIWSNSNRRYIYDRDFLTEEKLQYVVDKMKLAYLDGSKKGEIITEADPTRFNDPFFTHPDLFFKMDRGEAVLNIDTDPKDMLIYSVMLARQDQFSKDDGSGRVTNAPFIITNSQMDARRKTTERKGSQKAVKLYSKMSLVKKGKIASILGAAVDNTTSEDVIENYLWDKITDNTLKVSGENKTFQVKFIELAEMKDDEFGIHSLIDSSIRNSILRKRKGVYSLFGRNVGKTQKEVRTYILDPENQSIFEQLEKAVEEVKG